MIENIGKTQRQNLTVKLIDGAKPRADGKPLLIYDQKIHSLALVVSPKNHKSLIIYKFFNGKPYREKICDWNDGVSIESARLIAAEKLTELAKGINPKRKKEEYKEALLFSDLWGWYESDSIQRGRKSHYQAKYLYDKYLQPLHNKKLVDILPSDVVAIVNQLVNRKIPRKSQANRVVEMISRLFNFAIRRLGYKGENPARNFERFPEQPSMKFMTDLQFRTFVEAVKREPDSATRDLFLIMCYTAARSMNCASIRFSEIRWETKHWIIPAAKSKSKKEMVINLSDKALAVLSERRQLIKGDIVFPTKKNSPTNHMTRQNGAMKRILKRAGLTGFCVHSIRKSVGSIAVSTLKLSLYETSKILCHGTVRTTERAYAKIQDTTLSNAANKIAEVLG